MISLLFEDHLKFSFFAYHIQNAEPAAVTPWNIGFTPMFDKKAATAAMMPHGMSVISQTRLMKQVSRNIWGGQDSDIARGFAFGNGPLDSGWKVTQ